MARKTKGDYKSEYGVIDWVNTDILTTYATTIGTATGNAGAYHLTNINKGDDVYERESNRVTNITVRGRCEFYFHTVSTPTC